MELLPKETLAQRFSQNSYLTTFTVPEEFRPSKEVLNLYIEAAKRAESTIKIFGKEIKPKRDFLALDSYNFSRSLHEGRKIEDGGWVEKILSFLNEEFRRKDDPVFNGTLVNVYTPDAAIGMHSDNEKDLFPNSSVVGISFYVGHEGPSQCYERIIKFSKKKEEKKSKKEEALPLPKTKKENVEYPPRKRAQAFLPILKNSFADSFNLKLENNKGYIMRGAFQKELTHKIDPEKRKNGIRISFTFRCFK